MIVDYNEESQQAKEELIEVLKSCKDTYTPYKKISDNLMKLMVYTISNVKLVPDDVSVHYHSGIEYGHLIYHLSTSLSIYFEMGYNEAKFFIKQGDDMITGPSSFHRHSIVRTIDDVTTPLRLKKLKWYQ